MKVFMFPYYVTLESSAAFSPALFEELERLDVRLEAQWWDGTIEGLPKDEPAIVRASSILDYDWKLLGKFCEEHGHLCFYKDTLVTSTGEQDIRALLGKLSVFLA